MIINFIFLADNKIKIMKSDKALVYVAKSKL